MHQTIQRFALVSSFILFGATLVGGCGNNTSDTGSGGAGGMSDLTPEQKCYAVQNALCDVVTKCPKGPTQGDCDVLLHCPEVTSVADTWQECVTKLQGATCSLLTAPTGLPAECQHVLTYPAPPDPLGGAYTLELSDAGGTCDVAPFKSVVGAVSSSSVSIVETDGADGTTASCSVTGNSGGPFVVQGAITQNGNSINVEIPTISPGVTMASPATGSLSFASPDTAGASYATSSCNFFFAGSETIAAGKIWVSFACDSISSSDSTCAIQNGVLLLEGCDD